MHWWHLSPAWGGRWPARCAAAVLGIHGVPDDLWLGDCPGAPLRQPTHQVSARTPKLVERGTFFRKRKVGLAALRGSSKLAAFLFNFFFSGDNFLGYFGAGTLGAFDCFLFLPRKHHARQIFINLEFYQIVRVQRQGSENIERHSISQVWPATRHACISSEPNDPVLVGNYCKVKSPPKKYCTKLNLLEAWCCQTCWLIQRYDRGLTGLKFSSTSFHCL